MLESIKSIVVPCPFTVIRDELSHEVTLDLTFERTGPDEFSFNPGLHILALAPEFVRGVNRVVATLNEQDHDTHFTPLI